MERQGVVMQDRESIQKAHDMLVHLLLEGYGNAVMAHSADVLCWVLQHEHNRRFDTFLLQAEKLMEGLGMTLERLPEMHYPDNG